MYRQPLYVLLLIFTISSLCSAQSADKHFQGPYVGADVGIDDSGDVYYGGTFGLRSQGDNNMVFGIEGTFGDLTTSQTNGNTRLRVRYAWSATGVLGYAFGSENRNLIFTNLGYGETNVGLRQGTVSASESFSGFRVGLGYERAITDNISVRLQGTYQDVGNIGNLIIGTIGASYRF
jgi:opacity protein-like surface antigen